MSGEDKKLFGAMRLFEALSGIDEELLAKADEAVVKKGGILSFSGKRGRLSGRMAAGLAAAASLLVVAGTLRTGVPMFDSKKSAESAVLTMEDMAESINEALEDEADDSAVEAEEAVVTKDEIGTGGYGSSENSSAIKESQKYIGQSDGTEDGTKQGNTEIRQEKESANAENRTECAEDVDKAVAGEKDELAEDLRSDDRKELTEAQARAAEGLGAYIPDTVPEGYTWESAKAAVNAGTGAYESIFVCWTKGMDSIMITVSEANEENLVLTDIKKKETYDVSLYEIPYAETVPEEFSACFQEPVFASEDMSLELVRSRMKAVADEGDTDTPRGNFSIFYPEGILLHFTGDGSAEEIWEMLR